MLNSTSYTLHDEDYLSIECIENHMSKFEKSCTDNSMHKRIYCTKLITFNINEKDIHKDLIDLADDLYNNCVDKKLKQKHKLKDSKNLQKYMRVLRLVIANLYNGFLQTNMIRYHRDSIVYSNNKSKVIKPNQDIFSCLLLTRIMDALIEEDYIFHKAGYYDRDTKKGELSRAFPKAWLQTEFEAIAKKYKQAEVAPDMIYNQSDDLLCVRLPKKGSNQKGSIIPDLLSDDIEFPSNIKNKAEYLKRLKDEILALNNGLSLANITLTKPETENDLLWTEHREHYPFVSTRLAFSCVTNLEKI